MDNKPSIEKRKENIMKAVNRQEPDWVPTMLNSGSITMAYAGVTYPQAMESVDTFFSSVTKIFDDMYVDSFVDLAPQICLETVAMLNNTTQVKLGPDNLSVEHDARTVMKDEDYPALIADPEAYRKSVMIPRLYPSLFTDGIEKAKAILQKYAEETQYLGLLGAAACECLQDKYQMVDILAHDAYAELPLDTIFDFYRGFKNTTLDIRRRKGLLVQACEKLWETMDHFDELEPSDQFVMYAPHIPTYLSPAQFEELYWPHMKIQLLNLAKHNRKALIATEGKWQRFYHHFREIPKDTCILCVDDDDIIDTYDQIGDWQCIAGGAKLADLVLKSSQECCDEARRVIEHCAPGGGFIFTMDKCANSPSDINNRLVDVFNFVHENY